MVYEALVTSSAFSSSFTLRRALQPALGSFHLVSKSFDFPLPRGIPSDRNAPFRKAVPGQLSAFKHPGLRLDFHSLLERFLPGVFSNVKAYVVYLLPDFSRPGITSVLFLLFFSTWHGGCHLVGPEQIFQWGRRQTSRCPNLVRKMPT